MNEYNFEIPELDPNEVHHIYYEGSINWSPDTVEKWAAALKSLKAVYPDEYYHRGLHTVKGFSGITIYLKNREPTEDEFNLKEWEGVPTRIVKWKSS